MRKVTFPASRLSRQRHAIQDRHPAKRGARKIVSHVRQTSPNPFALTSSPNDAVCPIAAKRSGRPQTCNGLPSPFFPSRGTHCRKRSRLSGRGASLATAYAVPNRLRSYRPIGQTLVTESPSLSVVPHGATRHGQERGSPFRLQLLRSVAPLSPHFPSLPAFLRFPPPDVP